MTLPRVLLVGLSLAGGGAEQRFAAIAAHLFGGRADVAVLTPGATAQRELPERVIDLQWRGQLSYPGVIRRLARRITQRRYDVVMSFGLFPSAVALIAARLSAAKTKVVINEITRPKMAALTLNPWRKRLYGALRRRLYRRSALITANSIDGLAETCALAGVPLERGRRVVNVVDVARLAGDATAAPIAMTIPEGRYVVCIGRLEYMKRVDTVIDAIGRLRGRVDGRLVIVGDGPARAALAARVTTLGLHDAVGFTGRLENPMPVLKRAAALVLASEYEGFSNAVLEAMFCDVPVITSYCSADARDMCERGAALGFDVGNAAQLAERLMAVLTDESLRHGLVQRAREYRAPHALERAIPVYEALILEVAGRGDGRR